VRMLPVRLRRRRGISAIAIVALAAAGFTGCAGHGRQSGEARGSSRLVLRLRANPVAAAQNGPFFAFVPKAATPEPVLVVDLRNGHRIRVARTRAEYEWPAAVAGSTVVWLEDVGANEQTFTLRAAAPSRRRRLARWIPADQWTPDAPFGGVAAGGKHLVYSLFFARYLDRDACIDTGACRAYVRGGGTMLVSQQSLATRRILPPARAVAVDGDRVAAAVVRRGALYTGKGEIVVLNLATGARRSLGAPTSSDQLALGRNVVVGITHRTAQTLVHVWKIRTGSLVKTFRFRRFTILGSATVFAERLLARDTDAVFAVDLRDGRRHVISRLNGVDAFGPWVWRQRVYWLEKSDGSSQLRSARVLLK
jgi:hypothetical protein